MTSGKRSAIGVFLVLVGAFWFILDLFWLPPLVAILLSIRAPERVLSRVWPAEFVVSASMVAAGAVLWRSSARKLSITEFLIIPSFLVVSIVIVFKTFGWIG